MERGTKELEQLFEALAILAKSGMSVAKDGQVNLADLQVAIELFHQHQVLLDGFTGLSDIPQEVKDLSLSEAQALIMRIVSLISELRST